LTETCNEDLDICLPSDEACTRDTDCDLNQVCDVETGLCVEAGVCGPGAGPCNIPNSSPGCEDIQCCEDVCRFDPLCCLQEWDQGCADLAFSISTCLQPD
jgi:hypothetical protein